MFLKTILENPHKVIKKDHKKELPWKGLYIPHGLFNF